VLRLPKLLPPAIVNEMVMTGRRMSAEEALRWGVVNRVVSQSEGCQWRRPGRLAEYGGFATPVEASVHSSTRHPTRWRRMQLTRFS
ncbi:enoyl-CoA hydratase-related protein, partial [Salmonella enterica subsp. enterica serovar Virginia]|nr:enoyl-CoA hydratase-related protein [Salmonella enterica subsp. enterica serovar Virginia]